MALKKTTMKKTTPTPPTPPGKYKVSPNVSIIYKGGDSKTIDLFNQARVEYFKMMEKKSPTKKAAKVEKKALKAANKTPKNKATKVTRGELYKTSPARPNRIRAGRGGVSMGVSIPGFGQDWQVK